MNTLLISSTTHGHTEVLALHGVADLSTQATLDAAVERAAAGAARRFVVDASGVDFMNSTALASLLRLRRGSQTAEPLGVVAAPGPVQRVILASRLDRALRVYESLEDALLGA
ncbi:MAG: hypothetical protein C0475_05720 [Planctomyces sp.]|nr:hypothetical protein [Planctomyces sp.]MBA4039645.1 hypothetical protein [Planctomyces sp.]MBA4119945.1 hypothetical protein [Isosphaera sp.]